MEIAYKQMDCSSASLSIVQQFHDEEKCMDVEKKLGPRLPLCRRLILPDYSECFDKAFNARYNSDEESYVTAYKPITWPYMEAKSFEKILRFMYCGDLDVEETDVPMLLFLSDFFRLRNNHFMKRMVKFVRSRSERLRPTSCALDLLRYVCDKKENALVDIISAREFQYLCNFSEDAAFMEKLSFEHLNALLEHRKNYVRSHVLEEILNNWVSFCNGAMRSQYRDKLMKNVDFTNVSSYLPRSSMNRPENFADDVYNLSSKFRSLSILKSVDAALEVGLGKTTLPTTMSWNVPHISVLPIGEEIFSPTCAISNLVWLITFKRDAIDYASFSLFCRGSNLTSKSNICISVKAVFTIKSHKEGREDANVVMSKLFSPSEPVPPLSGVKLLLSWKELVDPGKGLVTDDDSITIRVILVLHCNYL